MLGACWFDGYRARSGGEKTVAQLLVFQQVNYVRRATPEVGLRCLPVLVTQDLRSCAPVRLVSRRIAGLESSRYWPPDGFVHKHSVWTYGDKWQRTQPIQCVVGRDMRQHGRQ